MTIDIEQLKHLAEPLAATNGADSNASWWDSFHRAANPAAVLELIAEIERLRDCLSKANANAERFEREWYLATDGLERERKRLDWALEHGASWAAEDGDLWWSHPDAGDDFEDIELEQNCTNPRATIDELMGE